MAWGEIEPIRVLLVDSDPEMCDLVRRLVEKTCEGVEVVPETDPDVAFARLEAESFDCVISDYEKAETNGIRFRRRVRAAFPGLPFCLFTGASRRRLEREVSRPDTKYVQKGCGMSRYETLASWFRPAAGWNRVERTFREEGKIRAGLIRDLSGFVYRGANFPEWPMEYVSAGVADLTGYDTETIESGEIAWGTDVARAQSWNEGWDAVQSALDDRRQFSRSYRIETATGAIEPVVEAGQGIYEDGDLVAVEGFVGDATTCQLGI